MREFASGQALDRNKKILAFVAALPQTEIHGTESRDEVPSYKELHLHPEVSVWFWRTLAVALPGDCRTVVYGHAALQHPPTGLLIAVAFGTHYILRVSSQVVDGLKANDASFAKYIGKNQRVDLREAVGPDWVYGRFLQEELHWCRASCDLADQSE